MQKGNKNGYVGVEAFMMYYILKLTVWPLRRRVIIPKHLEPFSVNFVWIHNKSLSSPYFIACLATCIQKVL